MIAPDTRPNTSTRLSCDCAVDDGFLADLKLAAVQIRLDVAEHLEGALAADRDCLALRSKDRCQ